MAIATSPGRGHQQPGRACIWKLNAADITYIYSNIFNFSLALWRIGATFGEVRKPTKGDSDGE